MPQFNAFQWNTGQWNGSPTGAAVYLTDLVVFDGFSLSDNTNVVTQRLEDGEPGRELVTGNLPRADGMYLIGDYYRNKDLTVSGLVVQSTAAALDAYLETMRKSLRKRAANLDVTRNGVVRRYVATLTNGDKLFSKREGYHVTICPFEAVFACKTPFAKDRDYSSVSQAVTTSPTTLTAETSGTVKTYPVVVLVFDAANTRTVVDVLNTTTGEEIQYTGSCAAGDVLIFDCEAKSVTKNAVAVNYAGSFPSLEAGLNNVKFTVTAASFSAQTTIKWKNAYL